MGWELLPLAASGPDIPDQPLGHLDHLLLVAEAHLHVDLGELGLAVGPQVLVAETFGDLEIAVEAADHQQLLKQLGGLGQGVELPGPDPAGDQVVSGPFGGGFGEHRRLHLHEAQLRQGVAGGDGRLGAEAEDLMHLRRPQIEIAVFEPDLLVDLRVAQVEGHRLGAVLDLQLADDDLHLAGLEIGVLQPFAPGSDLAGGDEDILVPDLVGDAVGRFAVGGIADELDDLLLVPEVDEDDPSMVAAAGDPTGDGHFLTDEFFGDFITVMGSHSVS